MARSLTDNAIAQFDAEVKQAYQSGGSLRVTTRVKTGVVGSTHRFPKFGKGLATPRLPQTDVIPMNVQQDSVTATIEDWNAPEYTDIFDQQKVNYSERAELAMTIANAIGRREDQLIIDAIEAQRVAGGLAGSINISTAALTVAELRETAKFLNDQAVPKSMRHIVWSPTAEEQLLGTTEVTSADFNTVRALVMGDIDTFLGFKFHMIETRDEGGLPVPATNERRIYAYHGGNRGSVGLAMGIEFRTTVDWIAEKTSWLSNGLFAAGSVVIDALGIVDIHFDEAP